MLPHGGESIVPSLQIGQGWHTVALLSLRIKIWFPEQLAVPPTLLLSNLNHRHYHIASFYHHNKCRKSEKMMR